MKYSLAWSGLYSVMLQCLAVNGLGLVVVSRSQEYIPDYRLLDIAVYTIAYLDIRWPQPRNMLIPYPPSFYL